MRARLPRSGSRFALASLAILLAFGLLAACGTSPSGATSPTPTLKPAASPFPKPASGTLRLWMPPLDRIDPIRSSSAPFCDAMQLVYEPLFSMGEDLAPIPRLCRTAVPTGDGSEWVLNLREDAVFHDGTPFRAVDAAASAALWVERGSGLLRDALADLSPEFLAEDETTLRIRLASPVDELPWLLRFPIMPASFATARNPNPMDPIPGTGPFRVVDYEKGIGLRLARTLPQQGAVNEVAVLEFTDYREALVAFHSDELDVLPLSEADFRIFRLRKAATIVRYDGPSLICPILNEAKSHALSDPARLSAVDAVLHAMFLSEEFRTAFRVRPASEGLPSGLLSLVNSRFPTPSGPVPTPTDEEPTWKASLVLIAAKGSFEAEIAESIVSALREEGIPALLRTPEEALCLDALANGRYDIAIRALTLPPFPDAPATELLAIRSGVPYAEPLLRSAGVMLGPRVYGEPFPCIGEIYRGIEETWVWSGS